MDMCLLYHVICDALTLWRCDCDRKIEICKLISRRAISSFPHMNATRLYSWLVNIGSGVMSEQILWRHTASLGHNGLMSRRRDFFVSRSVTGNDLFPVEHVTCTFVMQFVYSICLFIGLPYNSMVYLHSNLPPTAPPPDPRRPQRVLRHEELGNYVTWPARGNSNVFLFNKCLYSSEISDCKSPYPDKFTTISCFIHTPLLTTMPFRFWGWRPITECLLQI